MNKTGPAGDVDQGCSAETGEQCIKLLEFSASHSKSGAENSSLRLVNK